mmetsp:Transcript_31162/g.37708  ORF Transcript_31162/g.37708 Transcript_31162/m.37708 type:complete len:181 (-) Transcript_31162:321-863(-)
MNRWNAGRRSSSTSSDSLSVNRWMELEKAVESALKSSKEKGKNFYLLRKCLLEIVFAHTYPRLDVEVSKHMNHLLKAPFCVHPKTGRVCVPMDPAKCEQFDPMTVPTVAQLLNELDDNSARESKKSMTTEEAMKMTAMGEYINIFNNSFLNGLMTDVRDSLAEKTRVANIVSSAQKPMDW